MTYWLQYIWQFGIGGLVFLASLFLIVKSGACDLSVHEERKWFIYLIVGFCGLALVYFLWTLAGIKL